VKGWNSVVGKEMEHLDKFQAHHFSRNSGMHTTPYVVAKP